MHSNDPAIPTLLTVPAPLRSAAWALCLVAVTGCVPTGPAPTNTGTAAGTTTGTTETEPTETTVLGSNYGSLILMRKENQKDEPPSVELAGIFPTTDPGILNLAQCAVISSTCLSQLPANEGEYLDVDPDRTFDGEQFEYSFAGTTVGIGPLNAVFQNAAVPHYYAQLSGEYAEEGFDGTYGVRIGGEWGDYEGWDDLLVSPMMRVMSHGAGRQMDFHDGQDVVIEWEPEGRGEVYLSLNLGPQFTRMWLLEDTGYYELDVDALGLGVDQLDGKMSLQRWNHNRLDLNGNVLDVLSIAEVAWPATYFYVEGRDEIETVDTCGETSNMNEYSTGQYWGRLADLGFFDDMDLGFNGSCTGFFSRGAEGFVRFDLPPRTYFSATMKLLNDDASLYLVTDCYNRDTCVTGSDDVYLGEEEAVTYFNSGDEERTIYAVFDGYQTTNGVFYSDITVNTLTEPPMHDSCGQATASPPLAAGGYFATITAYTNLLDPAQGGCTPNPAIGPEAMTKVEVPAGETISVNVTMTGGDPVIYLLYNCSNTNSCAAGADQSVGSNEMMQYTNNTGSTETLFLVVDSKTALLPWTMIVDIQ